MGRTADYSKERCAVAAALQVVGDPWTLLILRDAFFGVRRFDEWQSRLGVARNVLAARLKSLVDQGILQTQLYSEHPPRKNYVLTQKGRDLAPVIVALKTWGDRHVYGEGGQPMDLIHDCGATLTPKLICEACGEPVQGRLKPKRHHSVSVGEAMAAMAARAEAANAGAG